MLPPGKESFLPNRAPARPPNSAAIARSQLCSSVSLCDPPRAADSAPRWRSRGSSGSGSRHWPRSRGGAPATRTGGAAMSYERPGTQRGERVDIHATEHQLLEEAGAQLVQPLPLASIADGGGCQIGDLLVLREQRGDEARQKAGARSGWAPFVEESEQLYEAAAAGSEGEYPHHVDQPALVLPHLFDSGRADRPAASPVRPRTRRHPARRAARPGPVRDRRDRPWRLPRSVTLRPGRGSAGWAVT
ncbi:hypothetical protein BX281_0879 [Streptomyces sp. Ag82_O1-15]|nr:hypothetical protein BX281_0879 [Streptomyces sp. Ag82_O1-15]